MCHRMSDHGKEFELVRSHYCSISFNVVQTFESVDINPKRDHSSCTLLWFVSFHYFTQWFLRMFPCLELGRSWGWAKKKLGKKESKSPFHHL